MPTEEIPIDSLPTHKIHEDDASTGIVSAPSLLTNEPNNAADSDGQDEANSVPGKKISGRLKRLVRPLVSFVAGIVVAGIVAFFVGPLVNITK